MLTEPTGARETKKLESRAAVLNAAATLFSRHGFAGVAIADIAAISGIRKPNLLYHFESKEELWKDTVDWVFDQVDQFFAARRTAFADLISFNRDERWSAFRIYVDAYYEACRRFPAYVLIPMIEGVAPSWRTDWIAERHLKRHVQSFDRFARGLIAEGLLPEVEPLHLQNMLTGGVQLSLGLAPLWAAALDVETHSAEFLDAYSRTVFKLLETMHEQKPKSKPSKSTLAIR